MKNKRIGFALLCAFAVTAISCFNLFDRPDNDEETYLNITLPGSIGRTAVSTTELTGMRYEITLTGPGGTIKKTLGNGETRLSEKVLPGAWKIAVRAFYDGADQGVPGWHTGQLRGAVNTSVNVSLGQTAPVPVHLKTVTGASNWTELEDAITNALDGDFVMLEADIEYGFPSGTTITPPSSATVTLLADGDREIARSTSVALFNLTNSDSTLILGDPLVPGTLALNGGGLSAIISLIEIADTSYVPSAKVIMNNNVIVRNSVTTTAAPTVNIFGGTFEMNGGAITGNTTGAGVVKIQAAGFFQMNGGSISGNTGDGVYVDATGGTFSWSSGNISGNTVQVTSTAGDLIGWELGWNSYVSGVSPCPNNGDGT
ncbi:MAG: hypothetical protein LBT39_03895, partial [Treponema sp.]|nr:hypothetical protein [Treponema sp.]